MSIPTREYCNRCSHISAIGFYSPLWEEVAGQCWESSTLCIQCFAVLGDERGIVWEDGLELFPLSLVTHLREDLEARIWLWRC